MSTIQSTPAFHDRLNLAVGDTSYRQLGTITETHPETVRRYMQGQAPSAAFMTNLCQNLGISGEWLLSGQGPMRVRDIRTHALKNADANELMGAIANTLTQLIKDHIRTNQGKPSGHRRRSRGKNRRSYRQTSIST